MARRPVFDLCAVMEQNLSLHMQETFKNGPVMKPISSITLILVVTNWQSSNTNQGKLMCVRQLSRTPPKGTGLNIGSTTGLFSGFEVEESHKRQGPMRFVYQPFIRQQSMSPASIKNGHPVLFHSVYRGKSWRCPFLSSRRFHIQIAQRQTWQALL